MWCFFMEKEARNLSISVVNEPLTSDSWSYRTLKKEPEIRQVYQLMEPEFISNGGLLRDISISDLNRISEESGEVWGAYNGDDLVAAFTVSTIEGKSSGWRYLNHGVVALQQRHRGGKVMEKLIAECVSLNPDCPHIVLTVARGIFTRSGFSEIDIDDLKRIDSAVGEIMEGKRRQDTKSYIYIYGSKQNKN